MAQNMNAEFIPKISNSIETLDALNANVKKGLENTVEMAEATGSAKFVQSAKNLEAGVEELYKAGEELRGILENVKNQYAKVDGVLN